MRRVLTLAVLLGMGAWAVELAAKEKDKPGSLPAGDAANGKAVFTQHCARCHGAEGKGDGPDAKRLYVPPRDLTSGTFKFRTTLSGNPPTDQDLMWVLNHGLAGSGMPSFANLEQPVKLDLIAYVKSLSEVFGKFESTVIAPPNEKIKPDPAKGQQAYQKLGCYNCHGSAGRADGPSAPTLKDEWGNPIRAANLEHEWIYRAGSTPVDIYYRLMAGVSGTPMPAYYDPDSDTAKETAEELWQLANYVHSLQLKANWSMDVHALEVEGDLPTAAGDDRWKKAPRTDVNLQGQVYQGGEKRLPLPVDAVSVQAVTNGQSVVFRLAWSDATQNAANPADSFLIAWKPADEKGEPRTNLHNLYTLDAPALDMAVWNASAVNSVRQARTNLFNVMRGGVSGTSLPATAEYKDGLWTLVVTQPLAAEAAKNRVLSFAAWDGSNRQVPAQMSASQWLNFVVGAGDKKEHH